MLTPIHVISDGYQGILPTEHFLKFGCVVNSRKEFVMLMPSSEFEVGMLNDGFLAHLSIKCSKMAIEIS